jgi:hypothetical protein
VPVDLLDRRPTVVASVGAAVVGVALTTLP